MRLIDAEKIEIPASMIYGMFGCYMIRVEDVQRIISDQPVAFDKEKVIEELDKLTGEECTLHECGIRSERCKPCIAKKAIEIVEKGRIE